MTLKIIKKIEEIFILKVNQKTGWGRTQLMSIYTQSQDEALGLIQHKQINLKLIAEIQQQFKGNLGAKTGWGKNEIYITYKDSILNAITTLYNLDRV